MRRLKKHRSVRFVTPIAIALGVAVFVWLAWSSRFVQAPLAVWQENRAYAKNPSAQLAYEIGERHFNSSLYPLNYDIDRAEYFFRLAALQDPMLPYVWHERARVAFLQGNFPLALANINIQIQNQGDSTPPSYYVRGLIEGYMKDYADAENDYAHFLTLMPGNWAGINDYAWVLLKDNKPQLAADVTAEGLKISPTNPWLLNSNATALYEMGDTEEALKVMQRASAAVQGVTPSQWSNAYPGNDPMIAPEGVDTFKTAVADNIHRIQAAASSTAK